MNEADNPYQALNSSMDTPLKPRSWKSVFFELLVVGGIIVTLLALILPAVRSARGPALSLQCKNNLKNIVLALHNYAARNDGRFPPAYTVDSAGRPLHSWRTLILRELDRRSLSEKVDFSKPWDDPANAEVCQAHLGVYGCPAGEMPQNYTTYLAIVGPNAFLHPVTPRNFDSAYNNGEAIGVIDMDSARAVPWMSPQDADEHMVLSLGNGLRFAHPGGTNVAYADGSVGFFDAESSAAERHKMIFILGDDDRAIDPTGQPPTFRP
ncbi:MAG: DUF1559 domain-containing protein [Planctomycetota bacterium]|nr:DUF1559 domain-containing protein [Planctomycetota bacterium]